MENKQPPAKRKTDQSTSPPAPPAKQQKKETTLESVASRCRDAISGSLLVDPVIAEDGHTYERSTIREWFRRCAQQPTSPLTDGSEESRAAAELLGLSTAQVGMVRVRVRVRVHCARAPV